VIVAERKKMDEIWRLVSGRKKVLVAGCGGCVTVCMAGGEKETEILASALRMMARKEGASIHVDVATVTRQCDPEYMDELEKYVSDHDCILSAGCGVGVQFVAERFPNVWVVPALNTRFGGGTVEAGIWEERCGFCGDCILYKTGGICPVARCSKSLLNGPCGGSENGRCEVSEDIECAWQKIYDRLAELGRLDLILEVEPPKDWSTARDGGPRRVVREDVRQ